MQPALLAVLVAASYLLLAGAPAWARPVLWVIALAASVIVPSRTFSFPRSDRALDLSLAALLIAITLQLIPLPQGVLAVASPNAIRIREATSLGANTGWLPLSVNASATVPALSTAALGVLAFWIARGVFSAGGYTRLFCRLVGGFAAIVSVVAVVQRATTPGLLMGTVLVEARNANPMGPFVNRNHFAGWLLMAIAVSVGYLVAHVQIHSAHRMRFAAALRHFLATGAFLLALCVLLTVATLLMTLSRSAVGGLGAAALCGAWLGRYRLQGESSRLPLVLTLAGVAVLALAALIDTDGWFTRVQQSFSLAASDFSRLTIWRESAPMVRDFLLAGTGAGTYGQAMLHYQESRFWIGAMQGWAHFNNAHSHYVQLASEGGLLLLLPALAAAVSLARLGLQAIGSDKGEMFWVRVGAMAGLVGIAVQSIWEVALTMPANAVLAGTLAGLLLYRRGPSARGATVEPHPA